MLRIIFFVLLLPSLCFGANYYVDPTYDGSNGNSNGSFTRPWTTIAQVNSYRGFTTGDGLYFRAGTVLVMTAPFYTRWGGTEDKRATVGAYQIVNNQPVHGLRPTDTHPILDGQGHTVPPPSGSTAAWNGLVNHNLSASATENKGYMTIRDLHIRNSGGLGIMVSNAWNASMSNDFNVVQNCLVTYPWRQGILIERSSYNLVVDNIVSYSSYGNDRLHPVLNIRQRVSGAGIEITAQNQPGKANHNIVRGNTVHHGMYEGIGVYQMSGHTIVEKNIAYDSSVNIYCDRVSNVVIRGNLVYGTPNAVRGPNRSRGIAVAIEMEVSSYAEVRGENYRIYGNYIAGTDYGVEFLVYPDATLGYNNVWVYNNRIVGTRANFQFTRTHLGDWEDIFIYDNHSFQYENFGKHTNNNSPNGVTWNRQSNGLQNANFLTGDNLPTSGNIISHSSGARVNENQLIKKSGWRNLKPGSVERTIFAFVGEDKKEVLVKTDELVNQPQKVSNFKIILNK